LNARQSAPRLEYGELIPTTSAPPKSDLYRDCLPLLNSGRIELPDLSRLHAQILSLERRTARGGRDSIDHPPGAHDDLANAVAGVALEAAHAIGSGEIFARNLSDRPRQRVAANASPLEMGGSGYTPFSRRSMRDEMPR
jgi:hypothetical protein